MWSQGASFVLVVPCVCYALSGTLLGHAATASGASGMARLLMSRPDKGSGPLDTACAGLTCVCVCVCVCV
eukprot:818396-Rhodomonas_salina.1